MKVTFLGTRGEIKPKTKRHRMHTSLLVSHQGKKVMIDCGTSWLGKIEAIAPDAIVLTHAHNDHAEGLKEGTPCPVYATKKTWALINPFPIEKQSRRLITPHKRHRICGIQFEAFPVLHSVRCPAVGYRITCGKTRLFYAPDVAWIDKMDQALSRIDTYIGDGATITRSMIRKHKETEEIFGHANVRQQLTWCQKMGVPKMVVTHCGSDIVAHEKAALPKIEALAKEREVAVKVAYDGMRL